MSHRRPFRELEDIISKQKVLEDLKEKLQALLDDINQVTDKCTLWIEKTDTITYLELKDYLNDTFSEYVQRCSTLVCENSHAKTEPKIGREEMKKDSEMQAFRSNFKDEENYNLLEKKIINMQKKLKSLDGNCKESQETSAQITKELHLASEFMSMLQTKTESLTQEMHINIQSQDKKIEHVSDKIEKLLETNNLLARQSEEHLHRTQIQKLSVELEQCQKCLESQKDEVKSLTEKLEKSKQRIDSGESEIKRLKSKEGKTRAENSQKIQHILANMGTTIHSTKYSCGLCRAATYNIWHVERLQEICKTCWRKELGV